MLGVWEGGNASAAARAPQVAAVVARALAASPAFTGREGQVLTVLAPEGVAAERLVLLGLGPFGGMEPHRARRLGAAVAAALGCSGAGTLAVDLDLDPEAAAAFAQGLVLRLPDPSPWHSRPDPAAAPTVRAATLRLAATAAAEDLWQRARAEAEGVLLARGLVEAPGNILTPTAFVERARALEVLDVRVEVIQGVTALEAAGCGLLAAVGRASAHPPALVTLTWPGHGAAAAAPPLVLVGKGITFDTGGLSLKPADGMERMKGDMGGAAAVLGAVHALAAMQAACPVVGVLAIAENMPGGDALRPGDILRACNGLTVEVVDTDAEGRLVLADAIAHATAARRPRAVVDVATLTGAVVTSLGRHMGGLFCSDAALATALRALGDGVGEPLWPLPLDPALDDDLRSDVADLLQCAPAGRFLPDALHAARFLSRFVPAGVPWAHLDIAGLAWTDDDRPLSRRGATGFGVRLLTALAHRLAV
ncbi:leucyl aminopeptidase family protein [Caenispirillum bisanense]|uniref:leucyl aminopeptidase family protein n=1 Tax=Caenispirillum bisanense TaxID=414052 RepID=UPI0031DAD9FF